MSIRRDRLVRGLSRRRLLQVSGASALAVGSGGALGGCAAAAEPAAEEAVFNPALDDWLEKIASDVGATLVEDAWDKGLSGFFSSWSDNVKTAQDQTTGYQWFSGNYYVHTVPPVVLLSMYKAEDADPLTDGLLACVNDGKDAVVFEPWAWQALSMFVNELTQGKTGADLAGFQSLCVLSLIPSGTAPKSGSSPEGSVAWMTYRTRNGDVEITRQKQPDGSYTATIKANGIPDADHKPTVKEYPLPTQVAG